MQALRLVFSREGAIQQGDGPNEHRRREFLGSSGNTLPRKFRKYENPYYSLSFLQQTMMVSSDDDQQCLQVFRDRFKRNHLAGQYTCRSTQSNILRRNINSEKSRLLCCLSNQLNPNDSQTKLPRIWLKTKRRQDKNGD